MATHVSIPRELAEHLAEIYRKTARPLTAEPTADEVRVITARQKQWEQEANAPAWTGQQPAED